MESPPPKSKKHRNAPRTPTKRRSPSTPSSSKRSKKTNTTTPPSATSTVSTKSMSTLGSVSSQVRKKLAVSDTGEDMNLRDINWRDITCIKKYLYEHTNLKPMDLNDKSQGEHLTFFLDLFKPMQLKSFGSYVCGTVVASHPHSGINRHLNAMENAGTSKRKLIDAMVTMLKDVINIESNTT